MFRMSQSITEAFVFHEYSSSDGISQSNNRNSIESRTLFLFVVLFLQTVTSVITLDRDTSFVDAFILYVL